MSVGEFKTCRLCQQVKPSTHAFYSRAGKVLRSDCKECNNARKRLRRVHKRPAVRDDGLKVCNCCKVAKPATTEFFFRKGDGLRYECKTCYSEYSKKRYHSNLEHSRAISRKSNKKRWENDSSHREDVLRRSMEWRAKNPERYRAMQRKWDDNNPRSKEYQQKYFRENPEKFAANRRNRRARLASAEGVHTENDVKAQFELQEGKCFYCKRKLETNGDGKFHVDHYIPIAKAGSNGLENLVCACKKCNLSENAKLPEIFIASMS